jgi:hypothetical protein
MSHEMPKAGPEHARLKAFTGEWKGEETLHPSPWDAKGGKATSRVTGRMDLDGFFLIEDYTQERAGGAGGGGPTYRGHGVFGWDASSKRYMMHWFDTMGMDPGPPAPGTWEGDTLAFQHQHPFGHSRYIYTFAGPDRYTFRLEMSRDGKDWTPFIDGAFTRVKP